MNKPWSFVTVLYAVALGGTLSRIPAQPPRIDARLKLPSLYVNTQTPADQLQLNADSSFSLQEDGQPFHGTFAVNGSTVQITIDANTKFTMTIQGGNLIDPSGQTWTLREQPTPTTTGEGALRNDDIIKLATAGIDDATIIAKIANSKCQFDTSRDALLQLKQSGVSDAVLNAVAAAAISQLDTPTVVSGPASTLPRSPRPAEAPSPANNRVEQLTPAQLEKTVASLPTTVGDLGVPSGRVATNATELAALRQLGERSYFEFKLAKTKAAEKVGDVQIRLTSADPKRNKYTITLILVADNKTVEKKDKSINQPVQFYLSPASQPYELVVNQINKDMIIGYLSAPKASTHGDNISQMLSNISDMLAALNRKQAEQGLSPENSTTNDAASALPPAPRPAETPSAVNKPSSQLAPAPSDAKLQAAIQQLGERNYYEFKLAKTEAPERVSDVQIRLVSADPALNRYTIILIADNKTIEKRDKALNERVQFYLSQASQPYELVVNEIRKDMIIGYISAPKVQQTRK